MRISDVCSERSIVLRIKQLTDFVSLLQNGEYVALKKELEEIKKKPDSGKRVIEIINKIREITGASKVPVSG